DIECYVFHNNTSNDKDGPLKGGSNYPLNLKDIASVDSIFSVYLRKTEKASIYIKIKSKLKNTSYIKVQPINRFLYWNAQENFLLGGYYGFLIFTCILSLGIFFYLKDSAYLYYAIFLLYYGLFDFSRNSLSVFYFYPQYPTINIYVWYIFLILALSAGSVFSRIFLNLKFYNPYLDKILFYSSIFVLFLIPIPFLFSVNTIYLIPPLSLAYLFLIFWAAFYVYSKGFAPAKYFIMGWSATVFGVLISLIASRFFIAAEYGSQIGSTLEIFFIMFAMLSRANKTQLEKDEIEEVAIDYKKELSLAGEIQQSLLPKSSPKIKNFDIHSFFLPMKGIGGDYYDFHQKNDHSFSIIMADVSGHGPAAALIASMVKLAFNETFGLYDRPEKAVRKMNSSLLGNLGKKFVTAMYAHINYRNMSLTYCSAGHPPILIHRRAEDKIMQLDSKGQFLGWFNDIKLREHTYKIQKGDRIIIYTDGLIEAFNKNLEMFDYDKLELTLTANENFSAQELTYFLIYRIKEW
ncbi:MAG: SpoIIE family protein phosphatase, partial [Leptospiraceae bacterium]|nr:SpoIIE family protein phosphatase [Leptospiraceae bacterium]